MTETAITTYRTEVNTGSGGFGFDNFTLQDALNDIRDYVSNSALKKFRHWVHHHRTDVGKQFVCENLECKHDSAEYFYIIVH